MRSKTSITKPPITLYMVEKNTEEAEESNWDTLKSPERGSMLILPSRFDDGLSGKLQPSYTVPYRSIDDELRL